MLVTGAGLMVMADADAKRFGGGGSIGRQSTNVSRQAAPATTSNGFGQTRPATASPAAPSAAPAALPAKPTSPWKGIVGGLVGGALLGALFSNMGMGAGMAGALGSILPLLLIAGGAFFLFRLFQKRNAASTPSYVGMPPAPMSDINQNNYQRSDNVIPMNNAPAKSFQSAAESFSSAPSALGAPISTGIGASSTMNAPAPTWTLPADFDSAGFLRQAKTYFIRLQAAWDKADINDIREFTNGEMYAEIKLQIQERGASPNVTDVVTLDAELLGIESLANDYLASVKFSGMIKEAANAPAEAFKEVWNLSKPVDGSSGWVLAGIQQL
ncbi:MAG: 39S ribosomal protein L45 [Burkholderiaceae bacterium]|nr:39S ribosomal protein L45 [Burkholderiaceae bacterium]